MKTVFVVGAGASAEFGFPVGSQLKTQIASYLAFKTTRGDLVAGDPLLHQALELAAAAGESPGIRHGLLLQAAQRIVDAMPLINSIDSFLDVHNADEALVTVGKLALASAILQAENRATALHPNVTPYGPRIDFTALPPNWISALLPILVEGCQPERLAERLAQCTFIVFNYDRVLEHVLLHALQAVYPHLTTEKLQALVQDIEIIHPYGVVTQLPWFTSSGGAQLHFGSEASPRGLAQAAQQVLTYSERVDEGSAAVTSIRQALVEAERLVFLGFAFHRQNLHLLAPAGWKGRQGLGPLSVYATAKGISHSDQESIRTLLHVHLGSNSQLTLNADAKAADLFSTYRLSLGFL